MNFSKDPWSVHWIECFQTVTTHCSSYSTPLSPVIQHVSCITLSLSMRQKWCSLDDTHGWSVSYRQKIYSRLPPYLGLMYCTWCYRLFSKLLWRNTIKTISDIFRPLPGHCVMCYGYCESGWPFHCCAKNHKLSLMRVAKGNQPHVNTAKFVDRPQQALQTVTSSHVWAGVLPIWEEHQDISSLSSACQHISQFVKV